jgi:hypothetical protein
MQNATCALNSAATACEIAGSEAASLLVVVVGAVVGLVFGFLQYLKVAAITLPVTDHECADLIEQANRVLADSRPPGVEVNPLKIPSMGGDDDGGIENASAMDAEPKLSEPTPDKKDMRVTNENFRRLVEVYGVSQR